MPWLARAKRRAGEAPGSRPVVADAAEARLCAWLSVSALVGLLAFTAFGWTWVDAVVGFVIAGFAVMEGREAWERELGCEDDGDCDEEHVAPSRPRPGAGMSWTPAEPVRQRRWRSVDQAERTDLFTTGA